MKIRNILIAAFGLALVVSGAFSGIKSTTEVKAANNVDFYITQNTGYSNLHDFYVHAWGAEERWQAATEAYVNPNGEKVFKATINKEGETGFQIQAKNSIHDDELAYSVDLPIENLVNNKGCYVTGWSGDKFTVEYWDVQAYTVSFDSNGGEGTMDSVTGYADINWQIPKNTFERTHYTYTKWNTSKDGKGVDYPDEYVISSGTCTKGAVINLYAQWSEDTAHIIGIGGNWDPTSANQLTYNPSTEEYTGEFTAVKDDQFVLVLVQNGVNKYSHAKEVESGSGTAWGAGQITAATWPLDDSNIKVVLGGKYNVTLRSNMNVYIPEIPHTYKIKVNTTEYKLVQNPGNANEYMTSTDIIVNSGDTIKYFYDDNEVATTVKSAGNNNCWSNSGVATVCLNMASKIYVNIDKTIFCDGLTIDTFGMSLNNNYVEMTLNTSPSDPSFIEYYVTGVPFAVDDVIKFVDTSSSNSNANVFGIKKINDYSIDNFKVDGDAIKCKTACSSSVYAKFKLDNDEVYFGSVSEAEATATTYATGFNSAIQDVCVAYGSTDIEALQTAWGLQSTAYSAIIESAQTLLTDATASSTNPTLKEFAKKYDYVYGIYGILLEEVGGDFASRNVLSSSNPLAIDVATDNGSLIAIVIVVSIVSLTALDILIILKRRKINS